MSPRGSRWCIWREQAGPNICENPPEDTGTTFTPVPSEGRGDLSSSCSRGLSWRLLICRTLRARAPHVTTPRLPHFSELLGSLHCRSRLNLERHATDQGTGLLTPSKASCTRAWGVHAQRGPKSSLRVSGTHLLVAVGNLLSFRSVSLHPVWLPLCLAPYLLSTSCFSHVFLLTTLRVSLTFLSRSPRPGRVGPLPEVSQLGRAGAGTGARPPNLCPPSPSAKSYEEWVLPRALCLRPRPGPALEIVTRVPGLWGQPQDWPHRPCLIWLALFSPQAGRAPAPPVLTHALGPGGGPAPPGSYLDSPARFPSPRNSPRTLGYP